MEDDLRWKMAFDGRWPSMEDHLRWKMTFNGSHLLFVLFSGCSRYVAFFQLIHLNDLLIQCFRKSGQINQAINQTFWLYDDHCPAGSGRENKLSLECHTGNPGWVGQIKMFFWLVEDKMSKCWYPSLPNLGGVWLHLTSWNWPDFQSSWRIKMEPSVAIHMSTNSENN